MIHKIILLGLILSLSSIAYSQAGKGFFVGSNISTQFSTSLPSLTSSASPNSSISLGLSPRLGYFINDRWAVGISGDFSYGFYKSSYRYNSYNWSVGIFGRYALPIAFDGKLLLWSDLTLKYKKNATFFDANKYYGTSISASISSGLLFFPRPKLGIEIGLGNLISYDRVLSRNGFTEGANNQFNFLNLGNTSPQVGLYYFFNR